MNTSDLSLEMALSGRATTFGEIVRSVKITDADGVVSDTELALQQLVDLLIGLREKDGMLYVLGNGGSAAVASHAVTDFFNVGKIRATTVHDSSLLTCMANDFGYEVAYARILSTLAKPSDVLVAISSSGRSPNITNAVSAFRNVGGMAITLSGFNSDNALRKLGHHNIWLDSSDYGFVEVGHQFVLHNLADRLRLRAKGI
jgi:D-sedoheptulose 7-phosphate isomerase